MMDSVRYSECVTHNGFEINNIEPGRNCSGCILYRFVGEYVTSPLQVAHHSKIADFDLYIYAKRTFRGDHRCIPRETATNLQQIFVYVWYNMYIHMWIAAVYVFQSFLYTCVSCCCVQFARSALEPLAIRTHDHDECLNKYITFRKRTGPCVVC